MCVCCDLNNLNSHPQTLRACLVSEFKLTFSYFKQYYTYFHTLFHPHVFQKIPNNNSQNYSTKHLLKLSDVVIPHLDLQIIEPKFNLFFFFWVKFNLGLTYLIDEIRTILWIKKKIIFMPTTTANNLSYYPL